MNNYKLAIIPGDGTGPEVVNEGLKVIGVAAKKYGFTYDLVNFDFGGARYLRTGEVLPASAIEDLKKFDSIFLGAIGHPDVKPGILEKGILLKLRFDLNQYINLRPVQLFDARFCPLKDKTPADINFTVVRENSEGLYAGAGGSLFKDTPQEVAIQESINTRFGVERCVRYAYEYARKYSRRKQLTLCGKTNVLTYAFDLWQRTFNDVGREYADIKTDYAHVDAITMWLVKNPEWFDVIVTDNMFG
ncbi:MAG: isocitrate/isopropylmalate family dehydrogenase, partial [Candidatus Omnitrophota bacterium]